MTESRAAGPGRRARDDAAGALPAGIGRHLRAPADEARVARARVEFLGQGQVPAGAVREPIRASWTRSRGWAVAAEHLELPYVTGVEGDTPLTRAANPVLQHVVDAFGVEPVSAILCDVNGVVLSRRTGDSTLERQLDRVCLAPGFSYAERSAGTNGIGTTLEARGATQVFGHEHFVERLEQLACAGHPIRHPLTGKVLGVVDLTCWRRDAGPLLATTVAVLAQRIEERLLQQSGQQELAVLNDYLVACRRSRGAVLAVSDDLLMMNDRARELLEPGDQEPLLAEAVEALATGRRHQLVVDLPSGRTARVHCRPTAGVRGQPAGGVLDVQLLPQVPAAPQRSIGWSGGSLGRAAGSGPAWTKCCHAVDDHLRAREWLVLQGEPGSGRETLARAAHHGRTPTAALRVFRADEAGPCWVEEVAEELATSSGTIVLADVDHLPAATAGMLADVLETWRESTDPGRPWVVVTVADADPDGAPERAALQACFPATVLVPPLRHHVEDVAELVPHLLAQLGRGGAVTCSPEAMRVLMHNRWPGNVDQLMAVLRKVVARRRSGVIEVTDLPPECRTTTKRVLSKLESLECDAIVEALQDAHGNKVEAARRLAMSRATIYRKIREYGITVESPPTSSAGRRNGRAVSAALATGH